MTRASDDEVVSHDITKQCTASHGQRHYSFGPSFANLRLLSSMKEKRASAIKYLDRVCVFKTFCYIGKLLCAHQSYHTFWSCALLRRISKLSWRVAPYKVLASNGAYCFCDKDVCSSFMKQAFHFIQEMQRRLRKKQLVEEKSKILDRHMVIRCRLKGDKITRIPERLANWLNSIIMKKVNRTFHFISQEHNYHAFLDDRKRLYLIDISTAAYFYRIWKEHCHRIKVWKVRWFSKSFMYKTIDKALREATGKGNGLSRLNEIVRFI